MPSTKQYDTSVTLWIASKVSFLLRRKHIGAGKLGYVFEVSASSSFDFKWARMYWMLVVLLLSERLDTSRHQEQILRTENIAFTGSCIRWDVMCCSLKVCWVMLLMTVFSRMSLAVCYASFRENKISLIANCLAIHRLAWVPSEFGVDKGLAG